jgi:hypothetical protein
LIPLLATILAQVPNPDLQHGGNLYWEGRGWAVYSYPEEEQCDLAVAFKNGERLTLMYRARERVATLLVTNKHASSLKHDQAVKLNLYFFFDARSPRAWNSVSFTAKTMPEAGTALISEGLDAKFVEDFAQASMFGIFTGKNYVAGSPLPGSADATAKLVDCAKVVAKIDPLDPFQK